MEAGISKSQPWLADPNELLQRGIELFNHGQFFDCHELLEQVWLASTGERKKFLQGLIQVAVALHHLRNENRAGAARLLDAAIEKLSASVPDRESIDVAALLAALGPLRERLRGGESAAAWTPPQILWKALPETSAK